MQKIIFINQETGPLLIDMINVFAKQNYDITLYTGEVIKTYADLDLSVSIRFLKKYKKNNNFNRLFSWSFFFIQAVILLIFDLKKETRIWVSTNPPFAPWLILLFKNVSFVHVYDVYPNALLALPTISKKSLIYRLFLAFNKKTFSKAKVIFTPSDGMKKMLAISVIEEKIKVIPWWANTDFIQPIKKNDNKFIKDNNLHDNFIVMYSGNLGLTHNVEKILNTALELKDDLKVKFVIIGEGPKKKTVDSFQDKYQLNNLLVLPFQDEDMLPHSLASADISIVLDSFSSGKSEESTASIPSKTYYLMAAGSVIYAESDSTSELNNLIDKYDLGMCDSSNDTKGLIEFISVCKNNSEVFNKYKTNSRKTSLKFTNANAKSLHDEMIKY
jgi:glycosyltransferase involved in cell wall biosynthesis